VRPTWARRGAARNTRAPQRVPQSGRHGRRHHGATRAVAAQGVPRTLARGAKRALQQRRNGHWSALAHGANKVGSRGGDRHGRHRRRNERAPRSRASDEQRVDVLARQGLLAWPMPVSCVRVWSTAPSASPSRRRTDDISAPRLVLRPPSASAARRTSRVIDASGAQHVVAHRYDIVRHDAIVAA